MRVWDRQLSEDDFGDELALPLSFFAEELSVDPVSLFLLSLFAAPDDSVPALPFEE
jgi:hypothetical protein